MTKRYNVGDKSKAICSVCKEVVSTTFKEKDTPLSDGSGTVPMLLVGECDTCHTTVSLPPQSTLQIKLFIESQRSSG